MIERLPMALFTSMDFLTVALSSHRPLLTKMAFGEHRKVTITPNDYVIISATPIPGNEKMVGSVVNALMKRGVEVIYEKMYEVHASGHACQEDLKLMIGLVKPKYFIPVHGEQKHLRKHAMLAQSMGIDPKNIYVADNGVQIEVSQNGIKELGKLPVAKIFVDGSGVGDVGNVVIHDRKRLSEDGLIVVTVSIDGVTGDIIAGPEIISLYRVPVKRALVYAVLNRIACNVSCVVYNLFALFS